MADDDGPVSSVPPLSLDDREYLRSVLEAEPACVKVIAADGTLVDMNRAGLAMIEADDIAQVRHQNMLQFVAPAHRDGFLALHRRVMGGGSGTLAFEIIGLRGTHRWLEMQAAPLRDANGRVSALLGVTRDISDERERHLALRDSERILEAQQRLLEMIAIGAPIEESMTALLTFLETEEPGVLASVLRLDPDGVHIRHVAAPSLPRAYVEAVDGEPIGPSAACCGTALYRRAVVTTDDIASDPLWDRYRDVTLQSGLRSCWSTPVIDQDGTILGTLAIYHRESRPPRLQNPGLFDVAIHIATMALVRHRHEAALAESEERFRATFEHAAVGVALVDVDGRFLRANPRALEIIGCTPADLSALTFAEITHVEDRATERELFERLVAGDLPQYAIEKRFVRKSGDFIWVNVVASMASSPGARGQQAIFVIEDVTERRTLEAQLRQSQKLEAVGLLAGGVAHDFNNVLSVILGLAELARDEPPAGPRLREDMQAIVDAATRGADITRQLLAFARKETARPVVLDVNASIGALQRMLVRLIGENISLETTLHPQAGSVKIDPTQFDQVILNLIANAAEAIHGPGTISIETRPVSLVEGITPRRPGQPSGRFVCITIRDSGVGMDTATQEQIFEPFFTTKSRGRGTGLGLAVVLGICQQAGGEVSVSSAPGQGATFSIFFPAVDAVAHGSSGEATDERPFGNETILVVEDERALLSLARRTLEGYGYTVLTANAPDEALTIAEQHTGPLDLLLTDVVMPIMSGRQLSDRITAMKPGIRTLYMSGYTADVLEERGDRPPEYVQKPFSRATLARLVRRVLDDRPNPPR